MKEKRYNVLGVMSGTSLDGIDCALVSLTISEDSLVIKKSSESKSQVVAKITNATTVEYSLDWKEKLSVAYEQTQDDLEKLNIEYTKYLGVVINDFLQSNNINDLDAICSHGHTILHQPHNGFTLQIGNLPLLSDITGHKIVCDFRIQDVALGGQGAPLVPVGDELLFSQYDYCLNLGGFANVSFKAKSGDRVAYDICPVNVVLNKFAQQLGKEYDDKGAFAKAGSINSNLLKQLNALSFYNAHWPKSLGIEWVEEYITPILTSSKCSPEDLLSTFTEHIAIQLASQFDKTSSVLITGGGAYNQYLLERLLAHKELKVVVPEATLVEFKEALIFALLGVLRIENKVNTLASVTGASQDHCAGIIFEKDILLDKKYSR